MTNKTTLTTLAIACACLSSCSSTYPSQRSYSPVHAQYETAGTLGQGGVEFAGHYTHNRVLGNYPPAQSGGNTFGDNIGFRFGYGFSDKFDLKSRYEYVSMPDATYTDPRFNVKKRRNYFFSVVPKINLQPKKFSLIIPLSFFDYES